VFKVEYILKKEDYPGWRFYGKRYLRTNEFKMFCTAVGLYNSHEWELEEYEKERILFPVARMIMPDEYARAIWMHFHAGAESVAVDASLEAFYQLDWAIRYPSTTEVNSDLDLYHPIDINWGRVDGLVVPVEHEFVPWRQYQITLEHEGRNPKQKTATHFYHYWQIYDFYQARKVLQKKYLGPEPVMVNDLPGRIKRMIPYLDAMSYYQYLYRGKLTSLLFMTEPDEDNFWRLDEKQQNELEASAKAFAQETIGRYALSIDDLYNGIKGLAIIHYALEFLERIRLADTLKSDIWRTVELIHYASGTPTEEIAHVVGGIAGIRGDYIELLFPNRRKRTKEKAARIIKNLAEEHNRIAAGVNIPDNEIEDLLVYCELTELSVLPFIVNDINEAHFKQSTWYAAEAFLGLKALASMPETLMRSLILTSGDLKAETALSNAIASGRAPTLGWFYDYYFATGIPPAFDEYINLHKIGLDGAQDIGDFSSKLSTLITGISSCPNDMCYLGTNLTLAALLRNFSSHYLVENPQLLRGQYVRCTRAILSTIFIAWLESRHRSWI